MARKRKNKRGARSGKKQTVNLRNLPPSELTEKGSQLLAAGKERQAIPYLKAAMKAGDSDSQPRMLLFRAYLSRASRLRAKGMEKEAVFVHENAMELISDAACLSEADILILLNAGGADGILDHGCRWLNANGSSPEVEKKLGLLLIMTSHWDVLSRLPKENSLCRDAKPVREALKFMNAGEWHQAGQSLKSVALKSPYAPARILCRAMNSFYNEDDRAMARALSTLPKDSPLSPLADAMTEDPGQLACLWDRPHLSKANLQQLMEDLTHQRIKPAADAIRSFSRILHPEDPSLAVFDILQHFWSLTMSDVLSRPAIQRLAGILLPKEKARLLIAKLDYYHFDRMLLDTAVYLQHLNIEFPEQEEHDRAAALILMHSVARIQKGEGGYSYFHGIPVAVLDLLGISSDDPLLYPVEMLLRSIQLDPSNTAVYRLLSELPRTAAKVKTMVESGLEKMMGRFQKDPFPCIALADLYYEKNAFRKAEQVLQEAKNRGPHDPRVTERHVLALLISADKRIRKGKLKLAAWDLEKAQDQVCERTLPLVTAKKFLFDRSQTGQMSLFDNAITSTPKEWSTRMKNDLAQLSPMQRLNTLGFIAADTAHSGNIQGNAYLKAINSVFHYFKKDLENLSSKEVCKLLMPLSRELAPVVHRIFRAGIYLGQYKNILHAVDDADIVTVLDALIMERRFSETKKEIKRRLNRPGNPEGKMLSFYLVVVRHLMGELINDAAAFEKIIDEAEAKETEGLRAAARRLSLNATGRLEQALRTFNFEILTKTLPVTNPFEDLFNDMIDEDDFDDEDEDVDFSGLLDGEMMPDGLMPNQGGALVEDVEKLVDHLKLRNQPGDVICSFRDMLKKSYPGPWPLKNIKKELTEDQVDKMSREAWEFCFGNDKSNG